ncbi:glucosaminidase domain-containing protein [Psychromonas sp. KJ10-10]|uniref:glucosaminidase domain-containing protein n=1 Tax=Psychromonas sp. KJ10-10 TaxID=3391823 RepID=UPI0039B3BBB6
MPPSLAVVQAAKESGWGTSRFAREGNALFGQWDFTGQGIKPLQQREELGNYSIATFTSPFASVEGYMLNINTNEAYLETRQLRAKIRSNNKRITGIELAPTLDKYSETGKVYTDDLLKMIKYNELESLDYLTLSDKEMVYIKNQ